IRHFVVTSAQSLSEVEKKLQSANKVEELIGGEGMEVRVAIKHKKETTAANAELHEPSNNVYYVLEGSATLPLGVASNSPRKIESGEWRAPRIIDGQKVEIKKGDLVIVPRGTPHHRSTAGQDFTMILIKIYDKPLPAPKSPAKLIGPIGLIGPIIPI